jgi:tetratricopeptide (TPR) repeat protein
MGKPELCPIPEAIQHTQKALDIYRGISQADPVNNEVRRDIAVSNLQLGDLYRQSGELERAVARTSEALAIYKAIYERDPRNLRAQDDLSGAWRATGAALFDSKRIAESIEHFARAAHLAEDLAKRNPGNARYGQRLAAIYLRLARAQRAGAGCSAALDTWEKGYSLIENLRKDGKLSPNELEEAEKFRKERSACAQ